MLLDYVANLLFYINYQQLDILNENPTVADIIEDSEMHCQIIGSL